MSTAVLMEREFEDNICQSLAERGWLYDPADSDWDPELALHGPDALAWLKYRQPKEYAKAVPDSGSDVERTLAEHLLLTHLSERVLGGAVRYDASHGKIRGGLLGALREGFKYTRAGHMTSTFGAMAAYPPANPILTTAVEAAKTNRLRVIRQVRFDAETNETIDLVLCVNGVPVVTMELKTDNTQAIDEAKKQYRRDRKPGRGKSRALLAPGRCLVHFAVSNSEVYMTTELKGEDTFFLPFNQGTEDGQPGNPPSETGSATDYLWRQVFDRDLFLRLLNDYALWEPAKRDKKGKAIGSAGRLIFPRFHQLRATEAVVSDILTNDVGGRYLIWHSAGSGKTKTMAWMAHNLIRRHDAGGNKLFDSVIMISDRTVLDQNIRDDIALLQASEGLIVPVGEAGGAKSPQLLQALRDGGHIISCTLQTFPEVLKIIGDRSDLEGRKWCVIADEAHSSQTGSAALALRRLLADAVAESEDGEPLTGDDLLTAQESAVSQAINLTYVALTATPKAKTLRLFGSKHGDGEDVTYLAFDTYTMAQAIGEGFILDVLGNYTTYDMLASVRDELGREEHVNRGEAVSDLVRFVRLHRTSIAQKVEVVVEHFRRNVMHHLDGHAKAMVVTSSRQAAVKWSLSMNEYIAKKGYADMRTLVAFSGSVDLDDDPTATGLTEAGLNQRGDTENAFKTDDQYRVLIVADKFQTGFDEPRLCAMYVDKKLSGITTVQTLSRLNRVYPNKPTPMILDFINTPEDIQSDFKVYYSDAQVHGEVDPNTLHDLADVLDTAGFYSTEKMIEVADAYAAGENGETLRKLITPVVHAWNGEYKQAKLAGDKERAQEILDFRTNLIKYKNAWEFLTQIIDYADIEIAKRAAFAMILGRNLKITDRPEEEDYVGGVTLSGVGLVPNRIEEDMALTEGSEEPLTSPEFLPQTGSMPAPVKETFERVIEEVNARFAAAGITANDREKQGFVTAMWGALSSDTEISDMAAENTGEQMSKSAKFKGKVQRVLFEHMTSTEEMGTAALANPELLDALAAGLAEVAEAAKKFGLLDGSNEDGE